MNRRMNMLLAGGHSFIVCSMRFSENVLLESAEMGDGLGWEGNLSSGSRSLLIDAMRWPCGLHEQCSLHIYCDWCSGLLP